MEADKKVNLDIKPVIMLVVDTLMDEPLQEAVNKGRAPALKFLMDKGSYFPGMVVPFPTMSVNVDTTLLTGTYCDKHHLPGLAWFDERENRLINYGTHYRELFKLGFGRAVNDLLFEMNEHHISHEVSTIHEDLEKKGHASASINALVYRGNTAHHVQLSKILRWLTRIKKNRPMYASRIFSYGSFTRIHPSRKNQYFWKRLGFNDSSAVQQITKLLKGKNLPVFSIVYLPELDQRVHKKGRMDIKGVEQADKQLQKILNAYPSWERAIEESVWITMGDNGQAWVDPNRNKALINLKKLLKPYKIMKLRKGVHPYDELVLAVNDRMAYIYTLQSHISLEVISDILKKDHRIDVIAWKKNDFIEVRRGGSEAAMRFKPEGEYSDIYGQSWTISGDLSILDLSIHNKNIEYDDYPDALARLHSSLNSHEGTFLIVSACPGIEFIGEGSPAHIGGAGHGGLHKQDSLVPIIITGTDSQPPQFRMVDLKKWILSLLDIK
ncbi:putative AlkP superfamily pyrophosphatase or phosphodiesterase [Peribacillus deserti]|uniref:AlkP superfamily pyrophosphatase or phosphodiesterase n=1 Tax=Peribacillus deserti TaxID=673318 RepID=A0ABS2QDD9_9BACI|nr:alkaline phosphatase family protein [Peribacillus deserti]MBM7691175.1 putative AlkP superfamily pyrophosphatase or phosphodiesterase [Peribacillus deserti]